MGLAPHHTWASRYSEAPALPRCLAVRKDGQEHHFRRPSLVCALEKEDSVICLFVGTRGTVQKLCESTAPGRAVVDLVS
jgi:hypothetical protein